MPFLFYKFILGIGLNTNFAYYCSGEMPVVSMRNVSKFYGKSKVLNAVSFDVEQGEIFGLLGSNGSGKSTILSVMFGLGGEYFGEVLLFGRKMDASIKKRIALVPQHDSFYYDFSVKDNLFFFGALSGMRGVALDKRVDYLLKWLMLDEYKNYRADQLSGGYQKLLSIAISLINDPELIVFDEPTVGLDPKMRQLFWAKINALKNSGKTILITTHYMDEAEQLCSRVALLKKGKIIALGKPADLIKKYGGAIVMVLKIYGEFLRTDLDKLEKMVGKPPLILGDKLVLLFNQFHSVEKMTEVTEWIMHKGYNIISSTTREPSLEDVFLNILGEKMTE